MHTCAPGVATHSITLETRYGVPTVALHTDMFDRVVQSVTKMAGLPEARRAFVPQPVMGKTTAELKAYVYGNDPVTGRPVMQEIIAGLTTTLTRPSLSRLSAFERTTPRLVEPDTEESLQQQFLDNNWTDKLPIVLPTEKRVAAMLAHTSRKPDEVVGRMQATEFRAPGNTPSRRSR